MFKKTISLLTCGFLAFSGKAQFTENFSPLHTWTQVSTGMSVTSGQAVYASCSDAASRRIYTAHGLTLTNNWRFDFDFRFTGTGSSGMGHHLLSLTDGTQDPVSAASPWPATNQDAIAAMFYSTTHSTDPMSFELVGCSKNDANAWVNSTGIVLIVSTNYYITLERLDDTHGRISVFSDAARTTHITGSPQCFTMDAGITNNLSVVQHGNTSWGVSTRSLTGWIDNDNLTGYVTIETVAGSQEICSGSGDPVAFTSSSASNNPGATFQWQSSIDGGTTWTNISGATSTTYDPSSGITQNTLYRRITNLACGVQHISNSLSVTVFNCNTVGCNYSTDFSSSTGWTTVGSDVNIASGTFNYVSCPGAVQDRMYTSHGVTLTNSWRLDFDFNFTAVGTGGPGDHLASLTDGTQDPVSAAYPWTPTNQDAVAAMFYSTNHTNDPSTFMLVGCSKNDNNAWLMSSGILLVQGTQYYLTLERLDQTHGRISVYSDAGRTSHISGSPQCFVIDANVTSNLSVLQHGNTSWAGYDRNLTGKIDNDCLSNLRFRAGSIGKDQKKPCGSIPASLLSTAPASGPNSYYTFGYQWQSSTDGITWTNISGANSISYAPLNLYTTTYFRRVAIGPCGIEIYSNVVTITITPTSPLDSDFSAHADCQTGSSTFTVTVTPNVSSGFGFHGNWTIFDATTSTTYTNPAWENCGPCTYPGMTFIQGHTYNITYTVKDTCSKIDSTMHTVTCMAGLVTHEGGQFSTSAASDEVLVFPNPTTGELTIDFGDLDAIRATIYNAQGKLVSTHEIGEQAQRMKVDLSKQPVGIYLIHVETTNGTFYQKVIRE